MKSTTVTSVLISILSLTLGTTNAAHVRYCEHKDFGGYCNGLTGPNCWNLDFMTNKITSYAVTGGTCWFFDGANCAGDALFAATNREHGQLGSAHNDRISSIRCD